MNLIAQTDRLIMEPFATAQIGKVIIILLHEKPKIPNQTKEVLLSEVRGTVI